MFCSDVAHRTKPLVLGTVIIISEMTSLPSMHLQSCMPAIFRVMENKRGQCLLRLTFTQGACSARTLSLELGPSLVTVTSYPTTVPIRQRAFIFLVAGAKSAHNSTQPLTLLRGSFSRKQGPHLIISLHRNLRNKKWLLKY